MLVARVRVLYGFSASGGARWRNVFTSVAGYRGAGSSKKPLISTAQRDDTIADALNHAEHHGISTVYVACD
jgi:hypothetical protein